MSTVVDPATRPEDIALQPRDWVALALPGLIWGSSSYLIAEGPDAFSPYLVAWMRIGFGTVVIASFGRARQPIPKECVPRVVLLSVVWMVVPLSLFALAQGRVSSSVTGMLNGANPIFTAVVAAILVRALPPARQMLGLMIGLLGVVLIALSSWSESSTSASGVLMILAAFVCYGIALNVAGPVQRQLGSLPVIGRALAIALVLMASNAGHFGSTRAASTTYLIPGVSIVLGVAFRGEIVDALALVASAIALSGAYLVNTGTVALADRTAPGRPGSAVNDRPDRI